MGMPENTFLKTMLIGGAILTVASLPMFWLFDMAPVCFLLLLTGILGVLGGLNANKGLHIAVLVISIIAIITLALYSLGALLMAGACDVVGDAVSGACKNEHEALGRTGDDHTCCFGCSPSTCGGTGGCQWYPAYESYAVGCANSHGMIGGNLDKDACLKDKSKNQRDNTWMVNKMAGGRKGSCQIGHDGQKYTKASADACKTALGTTDFVSTSLTKPKKCSTASSVEKDANAKYKNTGCAHDAEGSATGDLDTFCTHVYLANFLCFLGFAISIMVSVMTCCTVCCGKLDDGGGVDSG